MFDFEKLIVYQKSAELQVLIKRHVVNQISNDPILKNQLKRSSLSIVLNIAEGSGRFTNPDRCHFYTIARGSLYETIAIIDILHRASAIQNHVFKKVHSLGEEVSKMLFRLIEQTKEGYNKN